MGIDDIIILIKLFNFFGQLAADQIYSIKKSVDTFGKVITSIVHLIDSDGDGVGDTEEVLFSFDLSIPDLFFIFFS